MRFGLCVSVAARGSCYDSVRCDSLKNFVISPKGPFCNTAIRTTAMTNTFKIGRDTDTGRFKPVEDVRKRDIIERVPKPGYGDTKPSKK